jgi:predicted GH43/DUF377 family glycosyl hydrolase
MLRRIFGPKKDEVTGDWRKLNNEEFHNLYSSPNIIIMIRLRMMKWIGHRILVGKRPLGRPRRRWDDRDIGWGCMDWIDLSQDRDHLEGVL